MVTRVAVTTGAPATAAAFSPTLPTHAAGDRLVLVVTGKYETTTVPTINQSWVLVGSGVGGVAGATGNDAGSTFWVVYAKDATSGAETAPTVTPGATAPNSWNWVCASHRPTAGKGWKDPVAANAVWIKAASDATTASPLTGTAAIWGAGNYPTAGDALFCVGAVPTDLGTALGATTVTNAGLSGGTVTSATTQYVENALGNDTAMVWAGWTGFTGTATAGTAMSFVVTGASNQSGSLVAVALRETGSFTGTADFSGAVSISASGAIAVPLSTPQGLVTFNPSAQAQNHTTASFTPRANSTIYVWQFVGASGGLPTTTISDSGGRTWTQVGTAVDATTERAYLWSAPAGASPTSMTVTFTDSASVWRGYAIWDVDANLTIKDGTQKSVAVQPNGATTTTGAMPAAATSGSLVVAMFTQNDDTISGPPLPAGFTSVLATTASGTAYFPSLVAYSTSYTSASVTTAQNDTNNPSGGAVIELSVASGNLTGASPVTPAVSLISSGVVSGSKDAPVAPAVTITSAGAVSSVKSAPVDTAVSVTAVGAVSAPAGSALLSPSVSVTTAGVVGGAKTIPVDAAVSITSSGTRGISTDSSISASISLAATGTTILGGGSTTVITDAFSRHPDGDLSGKVAETGQTWVTLPTRPSAKIVGGKIVGDGSRTRSWVQTGQTDGSVTALYDSTGQWPSLSLRGEETGRHYSTEHALSGVYLEIVTGAGSGSVLAGPLSNNLTAGQTHRFEVVEEAGGTRLTYYVNGVSIGTYLHTATDRPSGTYAGAGSEQSGGWSTFRFESANASSAIHGNQNAAVSISAVGAVSTGKSASVSASVAVTTNGSSSSSPSIDSAVMISASGVRGTVLPSPTNVGVSVTAAGGLQSNKSASVSPAVAVAASGSTSVIAGALVSVGVSVTSSGSTLLNKNSGLNPAVSVTAAGAVSGSVGAPRTAAVAITASGTTSVMGSAPMNVGVSLQSSGAAQGDGIVQRPVGVSISATGLMSSGMNAPVTPAFTISTSGVVGRLSPAAVAPAVALTSAGGVRADRSVSPAVSITASGVVSSAISAQWTTAVSLAAAGSLGKISAAPRAASVSISAAGGASSAPLRSVGVSISATGMVFGSAPMQISATPYTLIYNPSSQFEGWGIPIG